MHFTNLAPGVDTSFRLWQCYDIPADALFDVSARVRLAAAPGDFIGFVAALRVLQRPACSGSLGVQTAALALQDTGGRLAHDRARSSPGRWAPSPRAATSASRPRPRESFDGWLDATRFAGTGALFSDGFESGRHVGLVGDRTLTQGRSALRGPRRPVERLE